MFFQQSRISLNHHDSPLTDDTAWQSFSSKSRTMSKAHDFFIKQYHCARRRFITNHVLHVSPRAPIKQLWKHFEWSLMILVVIRADFSSLWEHPRIAFVCFYVAAIHVFCLSDMAQVSCGRKSICVQNSNIIGHGDSENQYGLIIQQGREPIWSK